MSCFPKHTQTHGTCPRSSALNDTSVWSDAGSGGLARIWGSSGPSLMAGTHTPDELHPEQRKAGKKGHFFPCGYPGLPSTEVISQAPTCHQGLRIQGRTAERGLPFGTAQGAFQNKQTNKQRTGRSTKCTQAEHLKCVIKQPRTERTWPAKEGTSASLGAQVTGHRSGLWSGSELVLWAWV